MPVSRARPAAPPSPAAHPPWTIMFAVAGWAAVVFAAAVLLLAPIPPLQDYNEWIYQGTLVRDVLTGHAGGFALKPWPVPNAMTQLVLGVMMIVLPALPAGKLFAASVVVIQGTLAWALCRRANGRDHAAFAMLVTVAILNSAFWSGYMNFQVGVLLLMLHLLLVRGERSLTLWQQALFGLLMFFAHALTLAVYAVHVGWRAVARHGLVRGTGRAITALLPALILLAWYSRSDHDYGQAAPQEVHGFVEFFAFKAYTLAKSGPYQNFVIGAQGDPQRDRWLYLAGVAVNIAFVVVALLPLAIATLRGLRQRGQRPELLTVLTGFTAFAVMPGILLGVVNIGERLLVCALMIALVCAEDWRHLRRYGAAFACLTPALVLYLAVLQAGPVIGREPDHLAVTNSNLRGELLFWHRPLQFRDAAQAAEAQNHRRGLGFTTSIVIPR